MTTQSTSMLNRVRAVLAGVAIVLLTSGCEDAVVTQETVSQDPVEARADNIVGAAADELIRMSDIEPPIALQLYDLEMQRHRLLRQSLEIAALEKLDQVEDIARVARVSLEPPASPRLDVSIDPARARPDIPAPVTILVFCNFESPHCLRMQTMLDQVMPLFDGVVRQAVRDFALPFHRNADFAAEAARCALEQGAYWGFFDRLNAGSGALDRARLDAAARAALLNFDEFARCVDSQRYSLFVAEDNEAAADLGVDLVPAVFVNGLYAGNSIDPAQLVWLIESELQRLQIDSPRLVGESVPTAARLQLISILHSPWPGQGLAMLAPAGAPAQTGVFREGDAIGSALIVRRIREDGVELMSDGQPEWLTFGDSHLVVEARSEQQAQEFIRPHRAVPVLLDRDEVIVRLADRWALQEVLQTVPMRSGDYRQLRISEVRPGSLYELLGLEEGDVILGVNEMPVHEADNPLWIALERDDEVRLRIMRRGGVAHHYTYRFDE